MSDIANICVYCGSGPGRNPAYEQAARRFGAILADNDIRLVYGGGGLGLMGAVARATLAAGGRVLGIIPQFLENREHMLRDVQDLLVTQDMHQRKQLMFEHADAFVALPGGVGTLEELVEMLTWSQLGQHSKPILLANIEGFWDPLIGLFAHMHAESFIREGLNVSYLSVDDVEDILPALHKALDAAPPQPDAASLIDRM